MQSWAVVVVSQCVMSQWFAVGSGVLL